MEPTLVVAALWVLFGGTHVGLASTPIRGRLVARLGEAGFTALFYLVASASFAALVAYYVAHRFEGAPGLAAANIPGLRWALMLTVVAGFMLAVPALAIYPRLPTALFGQPIRSPTGIERITRHPFFAGTALFAIAQALLATHAVGAFFFGALALLAIAGARHQDVKLLGRRGPAYADYLAATSAVPFGAIIAGRQRLVWRELPVGGLLLGVGFALALRTWHDAVVAHDGAWIIAAFLGGALIAGGNAWRRARRLRASAVSVADASVHPGPPRRVIRKEGFMKWNAGSLLMATGVGHALVGVVLFYDPLAAILRDGFFNAIGPHVDREAAFWFLLLSPVLFLFGQVVNRAVEHRDAPLLNLFGWHVLVLGVVGAMVLPISGFWILIAIAPLIFKAARSADPRSAPFAGATSRRA